MTKQPEDRKKSRNRISDEMRLCIELMATEGLSVHFAADKANIHRDTAVRNLRKPHVLAVYNQRMQEIRENAAQGAFLRMVYLAENSQSDHVRLDANKWLAGLDGIAPVRTVSGHVSHNHDAWDFAYRKIEEDDGTVSPEEFLAPFTHQKNF